MVVRVLVVDDYQPWLHFIRSMLQEASELPIIGEASDGREAVQKAIQLQPDLILLDIGLPTLNGIEVARQIRKHDPNATILFVSEQRSQDVVMEALSTGSGYVIKSYASRELMPAIKTVLEGERFVSAGVGGHDLDSTPNDRSAYHPHRTEMVAQKGENRRHEAAFYRDDAALVDGFARFVEAALKAGDPAIVIATESHSVSLFQRLSHDGVDVSASIEQGMYIPLDVPDTLSTFMANDLPDPVRFTNVAGDLIKRAAKAAKGGRRQVAACGECAPFLLAKGNAEAAIRLENLWDEIATNYDVDILCGYVSTALQEKENSHNLLSICAKHSAIHGRETSA
ncbi:MAG TPA: response regulator [Terriglobales bacterium]|jgi:DNA-binding NarL/FixJ family response regulator|nr:response regulator [Terriglobales bacterium]